METEAQGEQPVARKVVFHRVAENLYRLDTSGTYYALLKRGDKQFRRSLKSKDRKLADRRLAELRDQVGNLKISEEGRQTFADLAKRWLAASEPALKPRTVLRRKLYVKSLSPFRSSKAFRYGTSTPITASAGQPSGHRRSPR